MKALAVRQSEEAIEKRAQLLKVLDQTKFTEDRSSGQRVHKKYGAERGRLFILVRRVSAFGKS
jgi:hypothetical protein